MKKHNDQPIQDVLKGMIRKGPLKAGYYDARIKEIWHKEIGMMLLNHTEKIHFAKDTIYLKLNSAPLRNELLIGKGKLIEAFNSRLPEPVVKDIVLR